MAKTLHILGTASQQPTRHRNHNGYFLKWEQHGSSPAGILMDCGEGTQRRFVQCDISCAEIDSIFLTHGHGDHTLGLPGIIQGVVNATKDFEKDLKIYYPAAMQKFFENLRYCCAYKTHKLNIIPIPIADEGIIFENNSLKISAMFLKHRMPTLGYRIEEKHKRAMLSDKLQSAGIIGANIRKLCVDGKVEINGKTLVLDDFSEIKKGKVFSFIMDTAPCLNAIKLSKNADLVVCESTYLSTEEDDALKNGHMTAKFAAEVAKQANAKRLVLTHFSQRYPDHKAFEKEAQAVFPNSIAVADGDVIQF